jgi:bifunctional oligoribonuclease and PAP phosphatase NrnA
MNLDSELVRSFDDLISHASHVLVGTHLNPDGDALGCALAMSHFLRGRGIENEVVCHHPPPKNLRFLPGVDRVRQVPKREEHELGIILDLDSVDRLGSTEPFFAHCNRTVVIDHHVPHEAPGDLRIVDVTAPATAVILTRLFLALGATIDPDMATCLLTGIVTDTGSFRFRNTTAEALGLSAMLLERGGNINLVSEEIFQRKPLSSTRLFGHMLETMRLYEGNRIAIGVIRYEDFERAGAIDEETEGFVNEMLSIDTVQIAAILRQPSMNRVRCSLRSRDELDIATVARDFGGGGHRNAAGCNFDPPLEEAEEMLLERLKICLESS